MHGEFLVYFFEPSNLRDDSVFILQAIILGTTFLQLSTNTTAYYSRGGILFLSVLVCRLSPSLTTFAVPYSYLHFLRCQKYPPSFR